MYYDSGTCEYTDLHGKRDFQIWLRILRWEDYPRLFGEAQCNHKRPCKKYTGESEWEDEGADDRVMALLKRGHEPRNVDSL